MRFFLRILDWPGDRDNPRNDYAPWWCIALRAPGMLLMFLGSVVFCVGVFAATLSPRQVRAAWRHLSLG